MSCGHGARHWFAYYGWVGSSSPVCVRYGCNAPNPRYNPDVDPYADEQPSTVPAHVNPANTDTTDTQH